MAYGLLALFADREQYPKVPPEFAEHVGWLVFGAVALVLVWAWARAESVRRALLALEDPRAMAVLRIGFALMTLVCFLNLAPYWRMLWSDEGIFDLYYARDRLGRTALRGWTPEDGFFDLWAVACFLWNKPSAFYIWGSPDFVVGYMLAFFGVLLLYAAGVFTRVMGVIAWLMMSGIYNRNALYWEGTDTVYRCFWFILLFAKTGHAWSIDNWWRCRRLRSKGLLAEPGDADTDASGPPRQPVYRLVPSWPRYLFMLQLAAIYVTTGALKTGQVWHKSDALYYALNMDHFYRFENATQVVSAVFATNLFRLMTWVTLWWERLFPLVLVGVVLRFGRLHADEPWYRAQRRPAWRLWLGRAALLCGYVLLYRIVYLAVPFCLPMKDGVPQDAAPVLLRLHIAMGVVVPAFVVAYLALRRWPLVIFRGGRSLGPLTRRFAWLRIPELRIDDESLRAWLLGRRLWLTLGVMFHGFLILFMNIGMFPFIMLMTYVGFVSGEEVTHAFRGLVARLRRRRRLARLAPPALDRFLAPAQATDRVPPKGRRVPDLLILLFGLAGAALVYGKVEKVEWVGTATYGWLLAIVLTATVFRLLRPTAIDVARSREPGPALAYGALGRALALGAVVWHSTAVAMHLFPSYAIFAKWRGPARSIFGSWLSGTGTTQSWSMFAPNPPRANTFMKTVVVTEDGERWDLRNNAFSYRPNPWIINDRMRKMHRRMVGKSKWYLRYWADYHCREWALEHGGQKPAEIDIKKLVTHIPPPEVVNLWQPRKNKGRVEPRSGAVSGRPYVPRQLRVREYDVQTYKCGEGGELPLFMKERYGLPVTDEDRQKAARLEEREARKYQNRKETWERRRDWGRWWADDETPKSKRAPARPQSIDPPEPEPDLDEEPED